MKTDYAKILRDRAEQARQDRLDASPLSLTQYKAQRDAERWREKYAAYMAGMQSLAGSPGESGASSLSAIPDGSADTRGGESWPR